jgi:hypothetical protein
MMSKERELLNRSRYNLDREYCADLIDEIQELLAQPEQQEPVAWKVIDGTNGEFMFSRVKPMERTYKYDVVIPLYTAPPKREPLSDKDIGKGFLLTDVWHRYECFIAGVKWAERQHGITGVDDE